MLQVDVAELVDRACLDNTPPVSAGEEAYELPGCALTKSTTKQEWRAVLNMQSRLSRPGPGRSRHRPNDWAAAAAPALAIATWRFSGPLIRPS